MVPLKSMAFCAAIAAAAQRESGDTCEFATGSFS
jgi:hypothetical protein